MSDGAVIAVRDRRAGRTSGRVVRSEHEMVDEKLRTALEKVCERGAALLRLEFIGLVDADPWQLLSSLRHLVALPRQLFFCIEQLEPRCQPLLACSGNVSRHP